jgi:Icc-related predicted phosphoesterase
MKIFLFSDLHASASALRSVISQIKKEKPEVIVFAGDFVNMGEPLEFAEQFAVFVCEINRPFLWVPGNNDFGRAYDELIQKCPSLEGREVEILGQRFTGVGGSPASWASSYAGKKAVSAEKIGGSIFVSHYPPPRVFNYCLPEVGERGLSPIAFENSECGSGGAPTGKRLVHAPLVHVCGHIHHQQGVAYLGSTKIIKLAAAETGHYAIMDLDNLEVDFRRF